MEDIHNNARATAFRLKELDLANKAMVAEIKDTFQTAFKAVNEGKNVRNIYNDNNRGNGSYYFNKTK